jgi:hypothetical protein
VPAVEERGGQLSAAIYLHSIIGGRTKLFCSALLHAMEILTRFFQSVQSVYGRARFEQGFRLHESETSSCARDEHNAVGQAEFGQSLGRS